MEIQRWLCGQYRPNCSVTVVFGYPVLQTRRPHNILYVQTLSMGVGLLEYGGVSCLIVNCKAGGLPVGRQAFPS
jgi:hypothetical protein